ncbi:hypothetical protein AWH56_005085 [Anaerobacillus isosaccharinicus]|uniref:Uncharacterized protein n=1 Tax=Anaerobacillus isosaccharinicus TaxID=1532552 RepID=A0A7S7L9S0_9BACI|nr:hypothetical protein [Anaerobacillus isosaccharinicus]MBA5584599.1 hypothetical protein [Anaerobacillus isosaccharinicus]QOY37022.1 hypothetical protein AWH56_005085 [Anaerobacillus isosaccharinicus]
MKTTWLNIINYSTVFLDLTIPKSTYFRMKILCEDISDLSGSIFPQQKMLDLLWYDFINQIKRVPNFNLIYDMLLERETKTIVTTRGVIQERRNTFTFFEDEQLVVKKTIKTNESMNFTYRINRKQALRGEVFLADMSQVQPNHHFTLERVLEIIYCDFIEKYKQGDAEKIVGEIVDSLN